MYFHNKTNFVPVPVCVSIFFHHESGASKIENKNITQHKEDEEIPSIKSSKSDVPSTLDSNLCKDEETDEDAGDRRNPFLSPQLGSCLGRELGVDTHEAY